jgi:hypothetical protein
MVLHMFLTKDTLLVLTFAPEQLFVPGKWHEECAYTQHTMYPQGTTQKTLGFTFCALKVSSCPAPPQFVLQVSCVKADTGRLITQSPRLRSEGNSTVRFLLMLSFLPREMGRDAVPGLWGFRTHRWMKLGEKQDTRSRERRSEGLGFVF